MRASASWRREGEEEEGKMLLPPGVLSGRQSYALLRDRQRWRGRPLHTSPHTSLYEGGAGQCGHTCVTLETRGQGERGETGVRAEEEEEEGGEEGPRWECARSKCVGSELVPGEAVARWHFF